MSNKQITMNNKQVRAKGLLLFVYCLLAKRSLAR